MRRARIFGSKGAYPAELSDPFPVRVEDGERRHRKSSARNPFRGVVTRVVVAAVVTNESADDLGLAVGTPATALFKASHAILATV